MDENPFSCQTIIDKILELMNEPNTEDTYVVVGLINFLDLELDQYRGWHQRIRDSSHTTKNGDEE